MPKLGRGRILIWEGGSLWIMEAVSATKQRARLNDPHSHHAVQVSLALEGDFEFESGAHRVAGEVVAVAPDAPHALNARGLFAHVRSEEHTSELQSLRHLVCRLLLEKKKIKYTERSTRP